MSNTDTEKSKLSGIEDSATADQTDLEIQTAAKADTDIADAITKKHIHANQTELDKITDGDHDVISSRNLNTARIRVVMASLSFG